MEESIGVVVVMIVVRRMELGMGKVVLLRCKSSYKAEKEKEFERDPLDT
eukprot:SAG31_NODE_5621_length_2419_cov_4.649138_3_plen_49_part_00